MTLKPEVWHLFGGGGTQGESPVGSTVVGLRNGGRNVFFFIEQLFFGRKVYQSIYRYIYLYITDVYIYL